MRKFASNQVVAIGLCVGMCSMSWAKVPPTMDLDAFVRLGLGAFASSPTVTSLAKSLESSIYSYRSALEQSPFSSRTDLSRGVFSTDENGTDLASFTRKDDTWVLSEELDIKLRSSLSAEFSLTYNLDRYQQTPPPLPEFTFPLTDHPYKASLTLSYDLIQGGSASLDQATAEVLANQSKQRFYSISGDWIGYRVQYANLLTDVFVTECKILQLKLATDSVVAAAKAGRLQAKTRTIAHKEYLNFIDLENNFLRQVANLESLRESFARQLIVWGDQAVAFGNELRGSRLDCDPKVEALSGEAMKAQVQDAGLRKVAQAMPSSLAAGAGQSASQNQLRATHLANLPSLKPYVQGIRGRLAHSTETFDEIVLGVALQWTPPFSKGNDSETAARLASEAADWQRQRTIQENVSRIASLATGALSQKNVMAILSRSLETSVELLRTLEASMAIGSADSLNYANAYINKIATTQGILDAWGALRKQLFEINEYQNWEKNGARREF